MSRLRCDACGNLAPDVVAPILFGFHGWQEFELDGEADGREYVAAVLLCDDTPRSGLGWRATGTGCASKMRAFVESGGQAGAGPRPPDIQTFRGGRQAEPQWR